ncbi:hypothetical protein POTOM_036400 [Populus tomentosa]|uniref:Uncharacterized protein n=1 Tax=Populus tomentosa TaxID=118781 RepID=A0A8X8CN08_POPTO|nr:hypothetical protein POTOM_036400 [Populus tomentosa]
MEKALTKVNSLKVGSLWISKKAKEEFSNITEDLNVITAVCNSSKGNTCEGKLTVIEGMKTKVLVWVKVTSVAVEGFKSDKVWFTAGVKKSRPKIAYDVPQTAIRVEEF